MTIGNAEFNRELNEIRLKVEIDVKMGEKTKKKRQLEGKNLYKLQKN